MRADESTIEVGKSSFVLDLALVEAPSGHPVMIGEGTIISHGATLHGCSIGDSSLIGIGSIVLDGARIGDRCLIAAGSLVPPGTEVDSGGVWIGAPARRVREMREEDLRVLRSEIIHLKQKIERYREQKSE